MNSGRFVNGVFKVSSCAYNGGQELLHCVGVQITGGMGAVADKSTCEFCVKI